MRFTKEKRKKNCTTLSRFFLNADIQEARIYDKCAEWVTEYQSLTLYLHEGDKDWSQEDKEGVDGHPGEERQGHAGASVTPPHHCGTQGVKDHTAKHWGMSNQVIHIHYIGLFLSRHPRDWATAPGGDSDLDRCWRVMSEKFLEKERRQQTKGMPAKHSIPSWIFPT